MHALCSMLYLDPEQRLLEVHRCKHVRYIKYHVFHTYIRAGACTLFPLNFRVVATSGMLAQ